MSDPAGPRKEAPGPTDFSDPLTTRELRRAAVWIGLATAVVALWFLSQPLLLILGGIVFASILDGGTRLLGRLLGWAESIGLVSHGQNQLNEIGKQLMGSLGRLTSAVGTALGAISSLAMILVIGIFVAIEPRLYERGIAWMLPMDRRQEFYETSARMASTLRRLMAGRLLGMAVEGVGTWLLLWAGGVPMAALLGILTGLLAFLPNIGAIVSGVLIVLVGFSAGFDSGIWAIIVYVVVQSVDGYLIVPMVAKRSVDLAPALILGAQLLFGALFGILGLALADPIVAMVKVLLEKSSELKAENAAAE